MYSLSISSLASNEIDTCLCATNRVHGTCGVRTCALASDRMHLVDRLAVVALPENEYATEIIHG